MEPAIIGTLIGAIGTGVAMVIKSLFTRNQNAKDRMDHEENLIKLSSSMTNVNQEISELRNDMLSLFRGMSKDMDRMDRKLEDFHSEWKDYNIVMLRHDITSVYEHYKDSAAIPQGIYQSTMDLYDKYLKLGGNSYVKNIIKEIETWSKT